MPVECHSNAQNSVEFSFKGRMDTSECMKISKDVLSKASKNKTVTFNLSNVEIITTAFLRLCVETSKQVGGNNFCVSKAPPNIIKIFSIAGLDKYIHLSVN